jgi:hypothetical protein
LILTFFARKYSEPRARITLAKSLESSVESDISKCVELVVEREDEAAIVIEFPGLSRARRNYFDVGAATAGSGRRASARFCLPTYSINAVV